MSTNLLIIFLPDKKNSLNILWTSEIICCTKCCKQVIRKKKHWRNSKKRRNQGDDARRQGFQQQANKVTGSTGSYFLSAEKDAEHFSYLICVWDAASGWESSDNLVLGGDSLRIFFLQIPSNTKLHLDMIDLDVLCAQQTGQILTH